jgi:hypothetical protein
MMFKISVSTSTGVVLAIACESALEKMRLSMSAHCYKDDLSVVSTVI